MDDDVFIKLLVVVYKNGLFTVTCEGGEVDCKVVSYAIKSALDVVGYVAKMLVKAIMEEITREADNKSRSNNGTM